MKTKTPKGWSTSTPMKRGIYRTARTMSFRIGSSYGYWDGEEWRRQEKWFDYSKLNGFIWQGRGERKRSPFTRTP